MAKVQLKNHPFDCLSWLLFIIKLAICDECYLLPKLSYTDTSFFAVNDGDYCLIPTPPILGFTAFFQLDSIHLALLDIYVHPIHKVILTIFLSINFMGHTKCTKLKVFKLTQLIRCEAYSISTDGCCEIPEIIIVWI